MLEPWRVEEEVKCRFLGPRPNHKIKISQVKIQILYFLVDSMILIHTEIRDPLILGYFITAQEYIRHLPCRLTHTVHSVVQVKYNLYSHQSCRLV